MERACANEHCGQTIANVVPEHVKYCTDCQLEIRDLQLRFPALKREEAQSLISSREIGTSMAAKLFGVPLPTLYDYIARGLIQVDRRGGKIYLHLQALIDFQESLRKFISIEKLRLRLGISRGQMKRFARTISAMIIVFPAKRAIKVTSLSRIIAQWESYRIRAYQKRVKTRRNKLNKGFGTRELANIFGVTQEAITRHIRMHNLVARKKGGYWYVGRNDLIEFCHKIIDMHDPNLHLTEGARGYLDSLAASYKI